MLAHPALVFSQVETGGEAVVMAGMPNGWGPTGLSDSQLDTTLAKIKAKASEIGADANVLRRTLVPYSPPGQPDTGVCICTALLLSLAICLACPAVDSCMAAEHFWSWLPGLHMRSPNIDPLVGFASKQGAG